MTDLEFGQKNIRENQLHIIDAVTLPPLLLNSVGGMEVDDVEIRGIL